MTAPLRILVATPLPATVTGGIEEYAYGVAEALRSKGHEVSVLTTRYSGGEGETSARVTSLEAKELLGRPVCFHLRSYLKLPFLVRRSDAVHVHMPFPFVEAAVAFLAKLMGRPLVVTYHMDARVDGASEGGAKWLHHLAERVYRAVSAVPTVELADRVCTNSRAYALQSPVLRDRSERLHVVHQGIDPGKFREFSREKSDDVRRQLLGEEYSDLVCFVGRLVPYKGLSVLLESVRRLDRGRTLFVIGGRGPEEPRLRRTIEDHHLTNVRLIGYVPDADLMNLFGAADLVLSPSVSSLESTPITLLYATAAGTAVLGTDVGGTAECIPNDGVNGLVVPAGDPVALGQAICRLLDVGSERGAETSPRFWSDVAEEYGHVLKLMRRGEGATPTAWGDAHPIAYAGPPETAGGK